MSDFRAFADSMDLDRITAFLENGLYISNTMLVMELDLSSKDMCQDTKEANFPASDNTLENGDSLEVSVYDTWELQEYLSAHSESFDTEETAETLEEKLSNPGSNIYVLRVNGEIASSVMVWDYDEDTVVTENIFTRPGFRGQHYATFLLTEILRKLKTEGTGEGSTAPKKVRLTVYGDNTIAVSFYFKMGYRITKVLQEFMYDSEEIEDEQ